MHAQHKTKAQKQTLFLMLLLACTLAFAGGKPTAKAEAASTDTAVTAASSRVFPPVESEGSYRRVHRKPKVIQGRTTVRIRTASVNKSGILAPGERFVPMDESGRIVGSKGRPFGGRTRDARNASARNKIEYICRSIEACYSV